VSYVPVLTKIDQLSKPERARAEAGLAREASGHTAAFPQVFATSALKNEGLEALKLHLAALAAS